MGRLEERIRIGIVGLGWVGQEVARAALEDSRVSLVGIADVDKMKAGRDLGEIIGEGRLGLPIDSDVETMLSRARPEVAVLSTTSDVEALGPTMESCIAHGTHVVTTCENLADAEMAAPQLDPGFAERARDAGIVVLATGVNPGFAMDRLPVMLSQVTRNIRRIRVVRVVDASTRRAQLQAKIGVGMTPHRFSDAIQAGEIGHAGLSSSLRLIAKGLGLQLEKTSEAFTPVLASEPTTSTLGPVSTGRVRGLYQIARGYRNRREVITLELTMALDEEHPRDVIDIVGEPPIHFEGELPGDDCTVAAVLSAVSVVVTMPPGLRTVLDVPLEQPEEPGTVPTLARLRRDATLLPTRADAKEAIMAAAENKRSAAKRKTASKKKAAQKKRSAVKKKESASKRKARGKKKVAVAKREAKRKAAAKKKGAAKRKTAAKKKSLAAASRGNGAVGSGGSRGTRSKKRASGTKKRARTTT